MENRSNRAYQICLQAFPLVIAITYSLSFCFWGRAGNDPYYWIMIYSGALQGYETPLSFLTMKVGHFIGDTFGYSLVSYRVFGRICDLLSVILPYLFIVPKEKRTRPKNLFFLSGIILLMGYGSFNEFSPGTLSFLLLSVLTILVFEYAQKQTVPIICAISFVAAISISVRFPNILCVLILVPLVLLKSKRKLLASIFFVVCLVVFFEILFFVFTGELNFVSYYYQSFNVAVSDPDHSMHSMIIGLTNGINQILLDISLIVLLYYLSNYRFYNKVLNISLSIILLCILIFFLKQNIGTHQWYNVNLLIFISSFCILFVGKYLLTTNVSESECYFYYAIFGILLLSLMPMGSDTGWMKLFPSLLSLMPVLLVITDLTLSKRQIVLVVTFFAYALVCFSNNNISHGQCPLFSQSEKIDHSVLANTHISSSDKSYIEQILSDYYTYGEDGNTIFYGTKAHMPYCLSGTKPLYDYGFRMHATDNLQLEKVGEVLLDTHATLFYMEPIKTDFFLSMIRDIDYVLVEESQIYSIYKAIE